MCYATNTLSITYTSIQEPAMYEIKFPEMLHVILQKVQYFETKPHRRQVEFKARYEA